MQFHGTNSGDEGFARKLDAVSWGLFIIWTGLAILVHVGWGWALFGLAVIILGASAARWLKKLPVDGFWIVMGLILLASAISELFAISWPLLPVLIIACGTWVLLSAFRGPHARTH